MQHRPRKGPAPAPRAIELPTDSLGAQLLLSISEEITQASHDIADAVRSVTRFRGLWRWMQRTANDPAAYDALIDIAWKLALVLGCALAAEWLIGFLLRKPLALLAGRMPAADGRVPTMPVPVALVDPPSSAADLVADSSRRRRRLGLMRLWQALVRLPFVLGRLVLELLPLVAFVGVATLLLSTEIGDAGVL